MSAKFGDGQATDIKTCIYTLGGDGDILARMAPDVKTELNKINQVLDDMKNFADSSSTYGQHF